MNPNHTPTFLYTNIRVRIRVVVKYLSPNDTLMNHLNEKQNVILKNLIFLTNACHQMLLHCI